MSGMAWRKVRTPLYGIILFLSLVELSKANSPKLGNTAAAIAALWISGVPATATDSAEVKSRTPRPVSGCLREVISLFTRIWNRQSMLNQKPTRISKRILTWTFN